MKGVKEGCRCAQARGGGVVGGRKVGGLDDIKLFFLESPSLVAAETVLTGGIDQRHLPSPSGPGIVPLVAFCILLV